MNSMTPEPAPQQRRAPATPLAALLLVLTFAPVIALVAQASMAQGVRRRAWRATHRCRNDNLRTLGVSAIAYMITPLGPGSRRGFMPHVESPLAPDGPETVGVIFETLVRIGEIDDPELFICPSSEDTPQPLGVNQWPATYTMSVLDVRDPDAPFSYGWTSEQRTDGNSRMATLLSADRSVTDPGWLRQHPYGRNVLYFDGSVDFIPRELELDDADIRANLQQINLARPGGLPTAR